MRLRPFLVLAPLLLAACGEEAPKNDRRGATGEVLQGSISDAMLPVDTVRSEPPLADPEAAEEVAASAGAKPAGESTAAAVEADVAAGEAPAAEPAAETED